MSQRRNNIASTLKQNRGYLKNYSFCTKNTRFIRYFPLQKIWIFFQKRAGVRHGRACARAPAARSIVAKAQASRLSRFLFFLRRAPFQNAFQRYTLKQKAEVAELADALGSGPSPRNWG